VPIGLLQLLATGIPSLVSSKKAQQLKTTLLLLSSIRATAT
jgi:hypothetical protein